MKTLFPLIQVMGALSLLSCAFATVADDIKPSLLGTWRVIGDSTSEAEALVRISERDGLYEGKIVTVFPRPGVAPDAICELCPAPLKNQPIQGLTILTGLRHDGDKYTGGEILDPDSGETYRCQITISPDNRKLHVRGFIGISLFGRTQTWLRE
jgi:uncharacterized protein (DUF2147 family)